MLGAYSSCFCDPCFLPDAACATEDATLTAELPTLSIPVQLLRAKKEGMSQMNAARTVLCNVSCCCCSVDGSSSSTSSGGSGAASQNCQG